MLCDYKSNNEGKPPRKLMQQVKLLFVYSLNYMLVILMNGLAIYWVYFDPGSVYGQTQSRRIDYGSFPSEKKYQGVNIYELICCILLNLSSVMLIWSLIMTSGNPGYFKASDVQFPLLKNPEFTDNSATLSYLKKEMYKKWTTNRF